MGYFQYMVEVAPEWRDVLLALFSQMAFESFEETGNGFLAFLPPDADRSTLEENLNELQRRYPFRYEVEQLPDRNWNTVWESNFQPIRVGDFCGVRADFHPEMEGVRYEVVINPKMAFGTGHHETTFMMMQLMETIDFREAGVLDYGCGTGILAILAAKMGARRVEAVDIEAAAFENTRENAVLNAVSSRIKAVHGTLEDCSSKLYDIVLANINRNVILASLPALYEKISPAGTLLVSGILLSDEMLVSAKARALGFQEKARTERGEWCCLVFVARPNPE